MTRIDQILDVVRFELTKAAAKHPPMHSMHEGYAILLEEVEELWDDIKADNHLPAQMEAIQVAAMAIRFLYDTTELGHSDQKDPRHGA